MESFSRDPRNAYESKVHAMQLSLAPMAFAAARLLCRTGLLAEVEREGLRGVPLAELQKRVDLPPYGIKVLAEAGLGIGLLTLREDCFVLTRAGHLLLHDEQTEVNMNFMYNVCWRGLDHLETALKEGRPAGLSTLGPWSTVYQGLSSLTQEARRSWFAFDHFYSDLAFPASLPIVLRTRPRRLLDVGGNTGRFATSCLRFDPEVKVTVLDLPEQIELLLEGLAESPLKDRIDGYAIDLLNRDAPFPHGYDIIWMSQFLDCFSTEQITSILTRAARSMSDDARLFILETYWDRQSNPTAAYCLQMISLYFSCIANGNSQMYHSNDLHRCIEAAGLAIVQETDRIGPYHTLTECRLKGSLKGSRPDM